MENHVSGQVTASAETPNPLAILRQSILAVLIGNALFTEEEQLLANHLTYECEAEATLAKWLRNVRLEDATRGFRRRNEVAGRLDYPAVCFDKDAHLLEMEALLHCRALDRYQKSSALWVATPGWGATDRLKTLGFCYTLLLENQGRIPAPRGYDALKDN
jgi:hypothetical protein